MTTTEKAWQLIEFDIRNQLIVDCRAALDKFVADDDDEDDPSTYIGFYTYGEWLEVFEQLPVAHGFDDDGYDVFDADAGREALCPMSLGQREALAMQLVISNPALVSQVLSVRKDMAAAATMQQRLAQWID